MTRIAYGGIEPLQVLARGDRMLAEAEALSQPGMADSCGDAIQVRNDAGTATMLAALIHDLRNPISVISANAEMLMDTEHSSRESTRLLTGIYRA